MNKANSPLPAPGPNYKGLAVRLLALGVFLHLAGWLGLQIAQALGPVDPLGGLIFFILPILGGVGLVIAALLILWSN